MCFCTISRNHSSDQLWFWFCFGWTIFLLKMFWNFWFRERERDRFDFLIFDNFKPPLLIFIVSRNLHRKQTEASAWKILSFLFRLKAVPGFEKANFHSMMGTGCRRAHACRAKLLRLGVQIPLGVWLFSLFSVLSVVRPYFRYLAEVQHYWFSYKNMLSRAAWGEGSLLFTDWAKKLLSRSLCCVASILKEVSSCSLRSLTLWSIK